MGKFKELDSLYQEIKKLVNEYDVRLTYSKEKFTDDLYRLAVRYVNKD